MLKKYLKISSLFIFSFSLAVSSSYVYAEDTIRDLRGKTRDEIKTIREERQLEVKNDFNTLKEDNKQIRENFREDIRKEGDLTPESIKEKRSEIIKEIEKNREEFKIKIESSKEELKAKAEEIRARWKEGLTKIKDEKKKASLEKIASSLDLLNEKITNKLSERINQIEKVLAGVKSRTEKAKEKGLDVAIVLENITKAEDKIASVRESILEKSKKTYEITITDELTVKNKVQTVRDIYKEDIKSLYEEVKIAHEAVRIAAVSLAKIPKIDEIEVENETDPSNSTTNQ